ncbi:DUF6443 domain-containing protein [Flectobacillus sp. DC10W]|uniref:DUF6443 domain-containing protein n=1 Tax=Flectobacillus longus TaxID=2984207 RepID=A0ABT6YRX7_9BACT|nr:DUF6443 domain-containing protein [Flectobacillus longus]MDI9866326.1 DUF6443 domain-containing protein [Flectobacillus longus]
MKRYIFFLFIASLFSTIGWSQTVSTDKNAVTHSSFRVATTVEADGSLSSKALINVQYFDGLGRPLSTVGYQQSPLQKDIISNSVSYDNFSRVIQQNNITPLSSSTGGFQAYSTVLSNAQSFYGDANPYTKVKTFDNSSLNRILEQYGAGASWQNNNKFVKTNYASAGTDVRLYKADASMNINLSGSYPANSLTKITNTDEQGNIVIEYKDRANKLIQKQVQDDTDYITTYYVYDDMDRLVAIIQPVAYSTNISITFGSTNWNEGVFFYIYDAHGNVTQKKIPSADWEYLVYDKWDRVVWSQDGLQRETGKWKFYKYDILNRLVMSGLKADARGLSALQTEASASTAGRYESRNATSPLYYSTTTSYPTTIASADVNIVNYFDSYTNWLPSTMNFIGSDFSSTYYGNTKGLQTGGASKNLETNVWMYNVTYFDTKGRTIQTFRHNVYGYIDRQEFLYNFDNGLAKQRTYWQKSDGSTFLENTLNIYDQAGRLTSVRHGFGSTSNDEVVQLNYDEVGRLIQKRIKATSQPANKYLKAKVLLYGALTNSTLMNAMTVAGIVPTSEPYTGLADRFIHTGGGGNEQTTMAVLSGNQGTSNAIVDWVFIELRSSSNPANILKTRSSLLQIDGDIVDVDGVSDVNLGTLPNSNYYVAIKHRNHLGAMTAEAVSFANTTTTVDFITRTPAQIYDLPGEGTNGIELQTTTSGYALWGGNANRDGAVIYQGPANDRAWVGSVVLTDPGNTEGSNNYIVYGYLTPDVNLDGKVIFQGPNNDLNLIFNSVYYYPLNTEHLNNYPIYEQLPLSSTAVISSATTTALQTIDYKYHIRGGLLGINLNAVNQPAPNNQEVDLFAYKLDYETAGRWDGNIGKQTWNKTSNQVRSYSFTYDNAKRLKSGTYSGVGAENYSLTNVNYDKNGNILNLVRNGNLGSSFGVMDNLTYTYTGNKLYKVEDAVSGDYTVDFVNRNAGTNDYDYYSDGSLKKDLNKEITQIDYDPFLKLPKQITLTNNRWIKITYAGDGRVLKRTYSTGEYWEYDGALVHKNGQPYQLATPEGRAKWCLDI